MRLGLLIPAALLLTACSDQTKLQTLEAQLLELGSKPQGEIEVLPSFSATVKTNLAQLKERDPFLPVKNTANQLDALNVSDTLNVSDALKASSPDLNRLLGLLEKWDLAQLSFSGSMQRGKHVRALIITPDKQLVAVKKGDRMGKNHGIITYLDQTSITLLELILQGSEWQERKQTINISK